MFKIQHPEMHSRLFSSHLQLTNPQQAGAHQDAASSMAMNFRIADADMARHSGRCVLILRSQSQSTCTEGGHSEMACEGAIGVEAGPHKSLSIMSPSSPQSAAT
jgi:hypothetical protein